MVTMNIDLDNFLLPFLLMGWGAAHQTAQALSARLDRGDSSEDLLLEWAEAAKGTAQSAGLHHLVKAVTHLRQNQWAQALAELREAKQKLPDMAPLLRFTEAMVLTQEREYENAFLAYRESAAGLRHQLELIKPVFPPAQEWEREFYRRWMLAGIGQGLEGLLAGQHKTLASGLKKLSQVFNEAKAAGQESSIWEVIDLIAQAAPDDLQPQFDVFRTAVRSVTGTLDGPDWIDELARVYTTPPGPVLGTPAHQVAEGLRGLTWPDEEFADDLEAVRASRQEMEEPDWSD